MKTEMTCDLCKGSGRVLDRNTMKYVPCPKCAKERAKELRTGKVNPQTFGIDSVVETETFSYTRAVKFASTRYTKGSISKQKHSIECLLNSIEDRKPLTESICYGLGKYGRPDELAYAIASKGYASGYTVAPVMTCRKLYDMALYEKKEISEIIDSDILIILIPVNPTRASLRHAVGIMQERALSRRATIFITTYEYGKCKEILNDPREQGTHWLATPVFARMNSEMDKYEELRELYEDNLGLIEQEAFDG